MRQNPHAFFAQFINAAERELAAMFPTRNTFLFEVHEGSTRYKVEIVIGREPAVTVTTQEAGKEPTTQTYSLKEFLSTTVPEQYSKAHADISAEIKRIFPASIWDIPAQPRTTANEAQTEAQTDEYKLYHIDREGQPALEFTARVKAQVSQMAQNRLRSTTCTVLETRGKNIVFRHVGNSIIPTESPRVRYAIVRADELAANPALLADKFHEFFGYGPMAQKLAQQLGISKVETLD